MFDDRLIMLNKHTAYYTLSQYIYYIAYSCMIFSATLLLLTSISKLLDIMLNLYSDYYTSRNIVFTFLDNWQLAITTVLFELVIAIMIFQHPVRITNLLMLSWLAMIFIFYRIITGIGFFSNAKCSCLGNSVFDTYNAYLSSLLSSIILLILVISCIIGYLYYIYVCIFCK